MKSEEARWPQIALKKMHLRIKVRLNSKWSLDIMDALVLHRIQFAFTITYHYLFPQLTMGLALLIVVLKTLAIRTNRQVYHDSARFWARIFGINFVLGVVTGIPMEFQFGTNWSRFAAVTGGVIATAGVVLPGLVPRPVT